MGTKVVLPFAALSLVVGLITSAAVSRQLAASASARVDAVAIHEEDAVASNFDSFEQRQLTDLRALVGTQGVTQAIERRDVAALTTLLYPAVANQLPDQLQATLFDKAGAEILDVRANPADPTTCVCGNQPGAAAWPHLTDVLNGVADRQGPKYGGFFDSGTGPMLYTIGPVLDRGTVVGAAAVGEPVDGLLGSVARLNSFDVSLYTRDGTRLASTTRFPVARAGLDAGQRAAVLGGDRHAATPVFRSLGGAGSDELVFVPLRVRGAVAGYAAVVVAASVIGDASQALPALLFLIFGGALGVTLLTGFFVTRMITRPLGDLLRATDQVAAGNLEHRATVASADELGRLASHFNQMTATLKENSERLDASTAETVRALAAAIDARDAYTHGHSVRVAAYSAVIADAAGLPAAEIDAIRRGCLVHDIGKIGVPDRILSKQGPLTAKEEEEMRRHPLTGYGMLRHLNWYQDVLDIVLHHHERWDGSGYPDRLAGESIPMRARLVAVADTLDAMTSSRPYRTAFSFARAAKEIEKAGGSQFDPLVIDAFLRATTRLRQMVDGDAGTGRRRSHTKPAMKIAS